MRELAARPLSYNWKEDNHMATQTADIMQIAESLQSI
jgi:hypothetical protein